MLLNPLSQNFVIWLPSNFFYSEVVKIWKPIFKRKYLPYVTIEDMFNAQITSISFPSVSTTPVTQQMQNYQITKRGGKQLDQSMSKTLSLSIKLSEGYMTYFMARQQFQLYMDFGANYKDIYLPPINITILDDGGRENITYTYYQITPTGLSDFDLSYAAKPGTFNTFQWTFSYNYFDIYYRDEDGNRKKFNLDTEYGMLQDPGSISNTDKQTAISKIQQQHFNIHNNSMLH